MRYGRPSSRAARVSPLPIVIMVVLALAAAGALYVLVRMVFAPRPQIALAAPFDVVGRNAPLALDLKDEHGLKHVRVTVKQGDEEIVVHEETFDPPRSTAQVRWSPAQDKPLRLAEGPGRLIAVARNASWGNFFKGKTTTLEKDFTARLVPPRLEVLTAQHYVNQAGCDMIVYRVTPPEAESGVVVGEYFFKGVPMPGARQPGTFFSIFAFPYDADRDTPIRLRARDEARNESLASFPVRVFPRRFRTRTLPLDDAFLRKVVPDIMSQTPSLQDRGDLLENYLLINRELRQQNNQELTELASRSRPEFLWKEPFQQLAGSKVEAAFADHRIYTYQGREVDRQDHLGYDLATTAQAPITASNHGVVVKAEFFGIYGNTVVIDHGHGLLSVYGHLSSYEVKVGDAVRKGQTIGRSGATGLAGGDHLHFSMVYGPTQVNSTEWWDPHWLEDRIFVKLRTHGSGDLPGVKGGAASATSPPPATR
ncbi:MAG TPA: M23 family metallopeptidase [Vicinamibacteria bacterium]|nr:M23 family metallopeptidase [Vicinamibacteria bacterium]